MHYCIYLFTKNLPTDEEIAEIMAPYYEYAENESPDPDIQWDGYEIGGRYGGLLKLKTDFEDDKYRWRFYIDEPRAGRLFRCKSLENLLRANKECNSFRHYGFYSFSNIEDTMFKYFGIRDGYIRVDGCKISDLYNLEDVSCGGCGFIDSPFNLQAAKYTHFLKDEKPDYGDLFKKAFERNRDNYVTILDLHI